jgi:hypothetical protein
MDKTTSLQKMSMVAIFFFVFGILVSQLYIIPNFANHTAQDIVYHASNLNSKISNSDKFEGKQVNYHEAIQLSAEPILLTHANLVNQDKIKETQFNNQINMSVEQTIIALSSLYNASDESVHGNKPIKPAIAKLLVNNLKQMLADDSDRVEDVLYFLNDSKNSAKTQDVLLSIVATSVNESNLEQILTFTQHHIGAQNSASINTYLTLIEAIPVQHLSNAMHQYLADLSTDTSLDINKNIDALSMLSPQHISSGKRAQLKQFLTQSLKGAPDGLTNLLLPQLLNFTDRHKHAEVILNVLDNSHSETQDLLVLDSITDNNIRMDHPLHTKLTYLANKVNNRELQNKAKSIVDAHNLAINSSKSH